MENTKKVQVQVLNAFVKNGSGGNPAGVVLDADALSDSEKLQITAKVGLSETAFISKSETADFKLDFFTPNRQIAHCGHATIAAFSYLNQLGLVSGSASSKETIDGNREIKLVGDLAFMEQQKPIYTGVVDSEVLILKSLGIQKSDLIPNAPILMVNTGNSFVIVPVKNLEILKNIRPNHTLISEVSETFDLIGFYVFAMENPLSDTDVATRMFAPRYGIEEESGTGMAAGPLAAYLYDKLKIEKSTFHIGQGTFMQIPSPSLIKVKLMLENGKIIGLMAGGKGLLQRKFEVEIDGAKS
ncbi:PhzF family phenazine biosynthesis isomerase [Aggregatimonas sangjinii]|uniref:PhzF family phenazine biosynthesis isomerase n=1 Tax=Aggregatimonas sangjinii TaxID=2583587 RepID=A0A5B7SPL4_9FLAO|nr:PhzF family phenazine biosynthesis isomerase [Aggregatimonas sangjinii]QCW98583.1 PhzF family phenazine biosynthesis isomerase [Aggregatimonas sangjinii]